MSKAQPVSDPGLDAKLDEAFPRTPADIAAIAAGDTRPPLKVVSDEEYDWLQRMKASNYQDVTAAPEALLPGSLAAALAIVQATIPEVIKAEEAQVKSDKGNYKYTYADLAAVTRAILPRLGAVGLSWVTMPTMLDGKFVLVYKLLHASGEALEGVYPLPAGATPQATGSAITYARRYCLCSVTGVAPADDDDAAEAQAAATQRPAAPKGMSRFERETGMALLYPPSVEQRKRAGAVLMSQSFRQALDFAICLDEHQDWDASPQRDGGVPWREMFADRIKAEIDWADTGDEINTIWQALKAAKLLNEAVGLQLKERAAAIKERNAQAVNTITAQILNAPTLEELEPARESITNALHAGRLTQEQHRTLCELHAERQQRLERGQDEIGRGIASAEEMAR
jgi:hypothetical protein